MSRASQKSFIQLPLIFTLALGFWSAGARGQDNLGEDIAPEGQPVSKGKPSDPHKMKFKFVDEEEEQKQAAKKKADTAAEAQKDAEEFKSYVGYPKHQFGVHLAPKHVASSWTQNSTTYNFNSTAFAYGLDYNFIITPRITVGIDYTHYSLSMSAATADIYNFASSSANFDDYFAKFSYCFISDESFERRFCPGFTLGNDSYPVLQYIDRTTLGITNVSDFVLGLSALGTWPIKSLFIIKAKVGFNIGTGSGSSGAVTSKTNSSYYGDLITDWKLGHTQTGEHGVQVGVGIKLRNASVSENVSNADVGWTSKVVDESANLGYTYTF